jgi:hypothetical protein
MQQVRYGAKRCQGGGSKCRRGGVQVRPRGRNERARTIGQDQNEIQCAVAPHPAKQRERMAFQRVASSDDLDARRIALEVGSVLPFPSTISHTPPLSTNWPLTRS